ncbi:hypothetical protein SAMN06295945_1771 [Polynucleobacter meluiroseus]|uniref:Lipoprotein n=1 Tax=Polynucleobacter meluiroseus TaxID=1938814 RepID=A0A240E1T2_9BURK|nr:hypothetical protein [Polynucleobacter meluiroseus]SNX29395.1 hypothetical protein SAMN06295945_1771 [Polynucleobacter meluiroseus]
MKRGLFLATLLCAAITGLTACSNPDKLVNEQESQSVYMATRSSSEVTAGSKNFIGPHINSMGDQNTYQMYSLEGTTNQQGATSYRLVIMLTYFTKWRYYDAANLENVPNKTFNVISREAGICNDRGCIFKELMAITLTPEFLASHAKTGFQLEIKSQAGNSNNIYVPAPYIQGFMAAVSGKQI